MSTGNNNTVKTSDSKEWSVLQYTPKSKNGRIARNLIGLSHMVEERVTQASFRNEGNPAGKRRLIIDVSHVESISLEGFKTLHEIDEMAEVRFIMSEKSVEDAKAIRAVKPFGRLEVHESLFQAKSLTYPNCVLC